MGWTWAIVIGILGCSIGFFLPKLADRAVIYKQKQRNRQIEPHRRDHWMIKIGASIINGFFYGVYTYYTENLVMIGFVGVLSVVAIIIALIDWRIRIIPNELVLITFGLGILYQFIGYGLRSLGLALLCMLGLIVIFVILGLIVGLDKIGAGDVKLVAVIGLVLGYPSIFAGLLAMSIALLVYIFVGMLAGKLTHVSMFPFAPFIMLGLICGLIYGVIY